MAVHLPADEKCAHCAFRCLSDSRPRTAFQSGQIHRTRSQSCRSVSMLTRSISEALHHVGRGWCVQLKQLTELPQLPGCCERRFILSTTNVEPATFKQSEEDAHRRPTISAELSQRSCGWDPWTSSPLTSLRTASLMPSLRAYNRKQTPFFVFL